MIRIRPYTKGELKRIEKTIPLAMSAANDRLEEYEDEHGELKRLHSDALWTRYYHEEMNAANDRCEVVH